MKDFRRIYELIYQKMIGDLSNDELNEFEDWKSKSPENLGLYNRVSESGRIKESFEIYNQIDVDIAFQKIIPQKENIIRLIPNWLKYGAAAIVLVALGLFYYNHNKQGDVQFIQAQIIKQTHKGQKSHFRLPDGTHVWMNSASSISYMQGFSDTARLVNLEGEAYFEVVKDNTRPFRVTAGHVITTALGTSFNINAYEQESIKVSLNTGKVDVLKKDSNERVILQPGEQAKAEISGFLVDDFNTEVVLAWKDGTIYFDNVSFYEMIDILEKWYGVEFVVKNLSQKKKETINVVGKYTNMSLENVLKQIGHSMKFEYKIDNKVVTLNFL